MDDLSVFGNESKVALPLGFTKITPVNNMALEDSEVLTELEKEKVENIKCEEGELKETCQLCGSLVENMNKHILSKHGEKVECQLCSRTFSMGNLRSHILKEHCQNKVTKCSLCEQRFVTRNDMKKHVKKMHASDTLTCSICHKEFKDLYNHIKYFHNNMRKYECTFCEKKFQAKDLLYKHVQSIHLGEKINCPDCKRDISIDNFKRHVKVVHQKMKKQCPHCEKDFSVDYLSKHIKEFHEKIRKPCPRCGKQYAMSNLSKHIKDVHDKICNICNSRVSYSISVHKSEVHNINKPIQNATSRNSNLELRNNYKKVLKTSENLDETNEGVVFEDIDLEKAEDVMDSTILLVGEENFLFSFV